MSDGEAMDAGTHHIVGGGIAGLAAAAFLIRHAGVPAARIVIREQGSTTGGSLDGSGDIESGYLVRGGRMFEPHYVCTNALLGSVPTLHDPGLSVLDDLRAFNEAVIGRARCRLVRDGAPAPDRERLRLRGADMVALGRLMAMPERRIAGRRIDSWFSPGFFGTNFWLLWATMFSFREWHDLAEMRRYLLRFVHLFPGLATLSGVLRTRWNQTDSVIAPLAAWLAGQGVSLTTEQAVADMVIAEGLVTRLDMADGARVPLGPADRVYLTLGSMVDGATTGSRSAAAPEPAEGPAFRLWRRLAARHPALGRPETFCGDPARTGWTSFTVTMDDSRFATFMERFTGNPTGTGGLVTFDRSGWTLSIVLFHQPHFPAQPPGSVVFWGYGLTGERPGDAVHKPMAEATGAEILEELAHHLGLDAGQRRWFEGARVVPCRMPFVTSQFMPRRPGDRPAVCPEGIRNLAILGQFCEHPRDCVFTVEYSVRSAWAGVHALTGLGPSPPPVAPTVAEPRVLWRALGTLLRN